METFNGLKVYSANEKRQTIFRSSRPFRRTLNLYQPIFRHTKYTQKRRGKKIYNETLITFSVSVLAIFSWCLCQNSRVLTTLIAFSHFVPFSAHCLHYGEYATLIINLLAKSATIFKEYSCSSHHSQSTWLTECISSRLFPKYWKERFTKNKSINVW